MNRRTKEITLSVYAAHKIAKVLATVEDGDKMEIRDEDGLKVIFIIKNENNKNTEPVRSKV